MKLFKSEKVKPENERFYIITQVAYIIGASGHVVAGIRFWTFGVLEMVWFNCLFSVPAFIFAFFMNRKGRHNIAFSVAFTELLMHQALGVYYIGWDSGIQYWLIYLIGLSFFNAQWKNKVRIFFFSIVFCTFMILYLFFKVPETYILSKSQYDVSYLSSSFLSLLLLALLINYYVQNANKAENKLKSANLHLEEMTTLLKKMFGRYLSADVMNSIIENPSALELGGEKRNVTIMMTDLRGFTALCERLKPEQVVQMLNGYFEVMVAIIDKYHGTVNEIIGDALLVIFGAPNEMPDRNLQAIACAIDMQNAMAGVNRKNRSLGLPDLEMGIGLNETEVIVGNIGSSKRSKYAVVGSGVNMTSRIESYTVGGQILISESVHREAEGVIRIDSHRDVFPKGSETPLRIYEVGGIAGAHNLALKKDSSKPVSLAYKVPLQCRVLEKNDTKNKLQEGLISAISPNAVEIGFDQPLEIYTNLKMNLVDVDEKLSQNYFYGKVLQELGTNNFLVRFTMLPSEIDAYFQALRRHAVKPEQR